MLQPNGACAKYSAGVLQPKAQFCARTRAPKTCHSPPTLLLGSLHSRCVSSHHLLEETHLAYVIFRRQALDICDRNAIEGQGQHCTVDRLPFLVPMSENLRAAMFHFSNEEEMAIAREPRSSSRKHRSGKKPKSSGSRKPHAMISHTNSTVADLMSNIHLDESIQDGPYSSADLYDLGTAASSTQQSGFTLRDSSEDWPPSTGYDPASGSGWSHGASAQLLSQDEEENWSDQKQAHKPLSTKSKKGSLGPHSSSVRQRGTARNSSLLAEEPALEEYNARWEQDGYETRTPQLSRDGKPRSGRQPAHKNHSTTSRSNPRELHSSSVKQPKTARYSDTPLEASTPYPYYDPPEQYPYLLQGEEEDYPDAAHDTGTLGPGVENERPSDPPRPPRLDPPA